MYENTILPLRDDHSSSGLWPRVYKVSASTGRLQQSEDWIEINRSQLSDVSLKKIFPDVINLKIVSEPRHNDAGLKKSFPGVDTFTDASLKKNFPGVNNLTFVFAKVFTSLKRSFPGVDDLKTGSGSTQGFTIPEVDSTMIPGVNNHGWNDFLTKMTPKSTEESL